MLKSSNSGSWLRESGSRAAGKGKNVWLDADEDISRMDGKTVVHVGEPRTYCLVKNRASGLQSFELATSTPGIWAYAFTFVSRVEG